MSNKNNYDEVFDQFHELMDNLPDNNVNFDEAERLATMYLAAKAKASRVVRELAKDRIALRINREAMLTICGEKSGEKTQAGKERQASVDENFKLAEKLYQEAKADEEAFLRLFETFDSAHVFYKNLAAMRV